MVYFILFFEGAYLFTILAAIGWLILGLFGPYIDFFSFLFYIVKFVLISHVMIVISAVGILISHMQRHNPTRSSKFLYKSSIGVLIFSLLIVILSQIATSM